MLVDGLSRITFGGENISEVYLGNFLAYSSFKLPPLTDYLLEGRSMVALDFAIQKLAKENDT